MVQNENVVGVRVVSGGKIHAYVSRAVQALQALPEHAELQLIAQGHAVAKAVSVAEIIKRRVRGLHQNTQIGLASSAPIASDEISGSSSRAAAAVPTIAITLSLRALDASRPGYQPPLTEEELSAAWIFDGDEDAPAETGNASGSSRGRSRPRTRSRKRPRVDADLGVAPAACASADEAVALE